MILPNYDIKDLEGYDDIKIGEDGTELSVFPGESDIKYFQDKLKEKELELENTTSPYIIAKTKTQILCLKRAILTLKKLS